MKKRTFDVIVIGAGSGLTISSRAADMGLKVAVIDKGPFGGTCLNRGCIPSKMLIHSADVADVINNSEAFGVKSKMTGVDWNKIQKRVWSEIDKDARNIEKGNMSVKNITVYKNEAKFIGMKTLQVGNEEIGSERIFICAGSRPNIPPIDGLDKIKYYTSSDVMRLKKQPNSMIVVGGGYIAAELAHFFNSLGTKVSVLDRGNLMLKREDGEIAKAFTKIASKKFNLMLNTSTLKVSRKGKGVNVLVKNKGKKKNLSADVLLMATGRRPNSDLLDLEKTKVAVDKRGYVMVNKFMETSVPGIWAIGDIAGVYMFKHSANLEAEYAAHNAFTKVSKMMVDYTAMPHAVFSSPQIAGVGMTEEELKARGIKYKIGRYNYIDTGMGMALDDKDGFVKVLVEPKSKRILGCHIIGHDASTLIHEIIVAMKAGLGVSGVLGAVHIHPALPEVVQRAFWSIE